jgi:hypothetical protein
MPIQTPNMEDSPVYEAGIAQTPGASLANVTTTQGELAGILNKGNALMTQAATQGNQAAAARGLMNSSMGVQAAQQAVIGAAMPIAQSDAAAKNQNSQFNASATNQNNQFNTSAQNQGNQFNTQQKNAMAQWNAGQQNEATLKAMDVNSREQLANIEANYKKLMQVNSSAENMYSQVMKNINDIQTNKDIADKSTAINSQLAWLRSGMQMIQNLNGVQNLVTF